MGKRKLYWMSGLTILLIAGGLTGLAIAAKHEPAFYRQCQISPSESRKVHAHMFLGKFGQMLANRKQESWGCEVTQEEMNCFFASIFDQMGETEGLPKLGISAPCVILGDEMQVRMAFRYGSGFFSTVISYDLKVWLAPKEPNVIVVQFQSARAGALPISNRAILQQLSDFAQKQNFAVNLYRYEGNTVAVIDLKGDSQNASTIMTMLKVEPHRLTIRGKTLENALPPLDPKNGIKEIAP